MNNNNIVISYLSDNTPCVHYKEKHFSLPENHTKQNMLDGQDVQFAACGIITVFSWVHTEHQITVSLNMSQHTIQLMIASYSFAGSRFALMESKVALVQLLSRFNLTVVSKTPIPIQITKKGFNMTVDGGFWLGLEQRVKV